MAGVLPMSTTAAVGRSGGGGSGSDGSVKLLASFDFVGVERTELSLTKGDIVNGVELRGMWWWGYNDKGHVGEFPITHVQALEAALAEEAAEDIDVRCLDTGDTVSAALLNTSVDIAIMSDSDDESDGGDAVSAVRAEIKRGIMLKRSVWWRSWRRRFFILEPGRLKMFLAEGDPAPKKLISLDGAKLAYSSLRSKGAFRISLKDSNEVINLCAYTDEERNDWMNKISRARPAAVDPVASQRGATGVVGGSRRGGGGGSGGGGGAASSGAAGGAARAGPAVAPAEAAASSAVRMAVVFSAARPPPAPRPRRRMPHGPESVVDSQYVLLLTVVSVARLRTRCLFLAYPAGRAP